MLAFTLLLGSPAAALAASPTPNPSTSGAGSGTTKGAAPSTGSTKAVYGIGPSSATGLDRRPRFKWSASPGGTLQDHVAVVNSGATPLTLDLYARDAVNQPDGSLGLQTQGREAYRRRFVDRGRDTAGCVDHHGACPIDRHRARVTRCTAQRLAWRPHGRHHRLADGDSRPPQASSRSWLPTLSSVSPSRWRSVSLGRSGRSCRWSRSVRRTGRP